MIVSRIISAVFGWLGSVTIARTLSPMDWGIYSFIFALLGLMAVVTDLGVGRAVLGRITSDDARSNQLAAGSFIVLRLVLGMAGYLFAVGYAVISGQGPRVSGLILFAGIIIILSTPANALMVLYQSRLQLGFIARWDIIAQMAQLLVIAFIAWAAPSVFAFIIAPLIREIITLASRWWGIHSGKLPDLIPAFDHPMLGWRDTLIESIPISIGYALFLLLTKVDQLMLERLVGFEPVGVYAISYKFSDVLGLSITSLALPYTTVLVTSYTRDQQRFAQHTRRAIITAATLGALAVVGFTPTADNLISLLYGSEFISAGLSARLLVVSAGFSGISTVALAVLLAAKRLVGFPIAALAALVVKVCLNLVLIPHWGMNGAAVATVITEGGLMVVTLMLVRAQVGVPKLLPLGELARQVVAVAAIGYPLMAVTLSNRLHWFLAGTLAVCLYVLYLKLSASWPFNPPSRSRAVSVDAPARTGEVS